MTSTFIKVFIVIFGAYSIYSILSIAGVFDMKRANKNALKNKDNANRNKNKRQREVKKLFLYSEMSKLTSFCFSEQSREKHKYYISRLRIESEILNRALTPDELRGKFITMLVVGLSLLLCSSINKLAYIPAFYFIFRFLTYNRAMYNDVKEEDAIIEQQFCNLYLLLYAQLRKGSAGRLTNSVKAYQMSVQAADKKTKYTMDKLCEYLLNNLAMYQDEVAVSKLTERYNSATVVNFANLASQALQGVDNYATLLSFRINLIKKKTDLMKIKSEKMIRKGQLSIYAIYLILAKYVLLSIISKLPSGSMLPF